MRRKEEGSSGRFSGKISSRAAGSRRISARVSPNARALCPFFSRLTLRALDVVIKFLDDFYRPTDVDRGENILLKQRKLPRRLDGVANLPAVELV